MISGRLGEIIQLIPIAFSALVIASLIESFIFLPIHAAHVLNPKSKTLSWKKINAKYEQVLKLCVKHQKSFLLVFIIIVPILIFVSIKSSKFQMFPAFDLGQAVWAKTTKTTRPVRAVPLPFPLP